MACGEPHLGLAGVVPVGLGAMGRDLVGAVADLGADGPEALALGPQRVDDRTDDRLDGGGDGVGGEVEIALEIVDPFGHEVAHDAADEIQAVAGAPERLDQRGRLGQQRRERIGGWPVRRG